MHIALLEPEIPPNTGNIIRLCANTNTTLHVIHPLGFSLDEKQCRRASMDYAELSVVQAHVNFEAFLTAVAGRTIYACTTKGNTCYTAPTYHDNDVLLFGPESRGLPADYLETVAATHKVRIPMAPHSRSMNLSNAVSVVLFEAYRQQGFPFTGVGASGSTVS